MLKKVLAVVTLAATPFIAGAALADPVYFLATVSVTDWDTFGNDYSPVAVPGILAAGGEVLVASQEVTVVEGEYAHNWTVVVKFPSAEAATGFYGSPDYQAVIPVRHGATNTETSVLMVAPQFVPPAQ